MKPLIGRGFFAEDEKPGTDQVAIISYGLWQRRFGGAQTLLQQQITLDGKGYTVIGVMPSNFEFPIQPERVELWTPLTQPEDMAQLRGAHYLDVVGRVKPNVSLAQARADLEVIASRIAQQYPKMVSGKITVVPLKQDLVGQAQPYLLMLAGAVLLVLLISIANVTSLMLSDSIPYWRTCRNCPGGLGHGFARSDRAWRSAAFALCSGRRPDVAVCPRNFRHQRNSPGIDSRLASRYFGSSHDPQRGRDEERIGAATGVAQSARHQRSDPGARLIVRRWSFD